MESVLPSKKYKRPESVLVVVYTRDRQVLLLRRYQPTYFWQSPAGSLEWNETPISAARRELCEETSLDAVSLKDCGRHSYIIYPMWRHRYAPGVVENIEYMFQLELDTAQDIILDSREHKEYRWLSRQAALELIYSYTNRVAIERLYAPET